MFRVMRESLLSASKTSGFDLGEHSPGKGTREVRTSTNFASVFGIDDSPAQSALCHTASIKFMQELEVSLNASRAADPELTFITRMLSRVGRMLWDHRLGLSKRSMHITRDQELVAVIDTAGRRVGVREKIFDLSEGRWSFAMLPAASGRSMPPGFLSADIWTALWLHGQLHEDALACVPEEYATDAILLKRMPRIEVALLQPRHYLLVRCFANGPRTFDELASLIGSARRVLLADLASLYMTRSLGNQQPSSSGL
jgi:hypothetical protein